MLTTLVRLELVGKAATWAEKSPVAHDHTMLRTSGRLALGNLECPEMLDERKAAILRAVVESHIRTAQPVSSSFVAQLGDLGVSPATVPQRDGGARAGRLSFQPHASAGRVPTDKGYRFLRRLALGPCRRWRRPSRNWCGCFFARTHGELERMLAETSGLLSG